MSEFLSIKSFEIKRASLLDFNIKGLDVVEQTTSLQQHKQQLVHHFLISFL